MDAVGRLLQKARDGELAAPAGGERVTSARVGWL
jgi:hypothetical protein